MQIIPPYFRFFLLFYLIFALSFLIRSVFCVLCSVLCILCSLKMHFSPTGFQLVSMDAQWMLKGCSMVAETILSTLSLFSNANLYSISRPSFNAKLTS